MVPSLGAVGVSLAVGILPYLADVMKERFGFGSSLPVDRSSALRGFGGRVMDFRSFIGEVLPKGPTVEPPQIEEAREFLRAYPREATSMTLLEFERRFEVPVFDAALTRILLEPSQNGHRARNGCSPDK